MSDQPSIDVKSDSSGNVVAMTNAMSPSAVLTNQTLEPLLSIDEPNSRCLASNHSHLDSSEASSLREDGSARRFSS